MTIDSAVTFLICIILVSLGIMILGIFLVVLNYIFVTFWKPVNFGYWAPKVITDIIQDTSTAKRFITDQELENINAQQSENKKITTAVEPKMYNYFDSWKK